MCTTHNEDKTMYEFRRATILKNLRTTRRLIAIYRNDLPKADIPAMHFANLREGRMNLVNLRRMKYRNEY